MSPLIGLAVGGLALLFLALFHYMGVPKRMRRSKRRQRRFVVYQKSIILAGQTCEVIDVSQNGMQARCSLKVKEGDILDFTCGDLKGQAKVSWTCEERGTLGLELPEDSEMWRVLIT